MAQCCCLAPQPWTPVAGPPLLAERQDIFQLDKPHCPLRTDTDPHLVKIRMLQHCITQHEKLVCYFLFFFMVPWILFSFLKPVFSSLLHFFLHYIVASSPFSPWSISPKFSHCCYLSIPASYQSAPPSLQTAPRSFPFKSTCWLSFLGADATISLMTAWSTEGSLLAFLWGLRRVSAPCWMTLMTKTSTTWADVYQ